MVASLRPFQSAAFAKISLPMFSKRYLCVWPVSDPPSPLTLPKEIETLCFLLLLAECVPACKHTLLEIRPARTH